MQAVRREMRHVSWSALLMALVCVVCVCGGARAAKEGGAQTVAVPPLYMVLGQDFEVSVATHSFGVFNATLYMTGSMTFPERIHAELVPRGKAMLSGAGQKPLPHFARVRGVNDEISAAAAARHAKGGDDAHEGSVPRPTLLTADILLQDAGAASGVAKVYYMPAEEEALQAVHETMRDGTTTPTTTVNFAFRHFALPEAVAIGEPALARQMTATVALPSTSASAAGTLSVIFFSEHEFTLTLSLPMTVEGVTVMEPVWVHGYTVPKPEVYNREKNQTFMSRYGVSVIVIAGFVLQILTTLLTDKVQRRTPPAAPTATEAKKRS